MNQLFSENTIKSLYQQAIPSQVQAALAEDLQYGIDITTSAIVARDQVSTAYFIARNSGIICGNALVAETFSQMEKMISTIIDYPFPPVTVTSHYHDGDNISPGDTLITVTGSAYVILLAERTALNFFTHLSGIASVTSQWGTQLLGTNSQVRDTRKTIPGLRVLEKYAVFCGGGVNHRLGLGDAILIKDNHIQAAGSISHAIALMRKNNSRNLPLEVEVDTLTQLDCALAERVELILLDNFPLWQTQIAVTRRNSTYQKTGYRSALESSGNLTLAVAHDYAKTGVDFLAVGALTHTTKPLDIGLDFAFN